MKNPSPLMKYHFWLLLGFVPLFVLIGAVVVDSSVSGMIEERQKKLDTAKSKVKSGPKSDSEIAAAAEMTKKISGKQGGLHQANWDRQKFLFAWPHEKASSSDNAQRLREIEFGETNIERAADRIIEVELWRSKFDEMNKASPEDRVQKVNDRKTAELEKATTPSAKAEKLQSILNDVVSAPPKKSEKMPDWLKELLTELGNPEQSPVAARQAFRKGLMEPAWPKFGEDFPTTNGQINAFKQAYRGIFPLKKDGIGGDAGGMADMVLPTQFLGGWHSRLRFINDWGQLAPTKDQIWLALEDVWIQRSLLEAVRSINKDMGEFRRCKFDKNGNAVIDPSFDEKGNKIKIDSQGKPVLDKGGRYTYVETPADEKQKGTFASRTWAVELAVVKEKNGKNRLAGKITNLTDRLQLMGINDTMVLNVWFKNSTQPMEFKFGREYLPGKGARAKVPELDKDGKPIPVLDRDGQPLKDGDGKEVVKLKDVPANEMVIEPSDAHFLPDGVKTTELARVEQVFDVKTVPVKRIDSVVLGFLDSRATAEDKKLQLPREPFGYKEDVLPTDPNAAPGPDGNPPGVPPGTPPAAPVPPVFRPPFGGDPSNPMAQKKLNGGDTLVNVTDGNKKRYIEVTPQFRRMPVGMVVILDQTLVQDMLMAIANSPLRFQITQVEWTRFHGKLDGTTGPGTSPSRDSDIFDYRFGKVNIPGLEESMPIPGYNPNRDRTGGTVSDSQVTSGLVELSIYGVVSLYEKYDPNPPAASSGTTGGQTPAPAGPTPAGPAPVPAVPTPPTATPKQRRRRYKR